jgi:hypothetical protein
MKMNRKIASTIVGVLMGLSISADAAIVSILERDFESGDLGASAITTPESNSWANTRPAVEAGGINGSSVPGIGTFDGFFNSRFMVVGDLDGNISASNSGLSSVDFALSLPSALTSLTIGYDWVFDTNNTANNSPDLFSVEFLVGSTIYSYLQGSATSLTPNRPDFVSTTRGTFSLTLTGTALSDLLTVGVNQIRFRLQEDGAPNSSAVGIDNILITGIVPAPATLGLLAIGLAGGVVARRKAAH